MSKRNHHLQPNFYLKGFLSNPDEKNPKVWVYEKGKPFYDGKTEQLQNPKHFTTEKAARKKDFYAFENENGAKNYEKYENLLRDNFEEPAKPIIEKIKRFEEINKDDKKILFKYIASMVTRGNWWKNTSEQIYEMVEPETKAGIEAVTLEIVKIAKEQGDERFSDASKVREIFQKRIFGETEKRKRGEYEKTSMIQYAERFAKELLPDLYPRFLTAPIGMPFLTSDNPVCYTSFANVEVQLIFPISSKICFLATRKNKLDDRKWKNNGKGFWQIDDKTSESIRDFIVRKAINEVYYSKKAEWLVEFINKRS